MEMALQVTYEQLSVKSNELYNRERSIRMDWGVKKKMRVSIVLSILVRCIQYSLHFNNSK